MSKAPLTRREHDLLVFLRAYIREHDMAPTVREMMVGIGSASTGGVHAFLSTLVDKGHITRQFARSRGIALVSAWEPIETAPKDRTILIFGCPDELIINGDLLVRFPEPGVFTAAWDEVDEAFCISGGSWLGPFVDPTHWMPLPDPPEPPNV